MPNPDDQDGRRGQRPAGRWLGAQLRPLRPQRPGLGDPLRLRVSRHRRRDSSLFLRPGCHFVSSRLSPAGGRGVARNSTASWVGSTKASSSDAFEAQFRLGPDHRVWHAEEALIVVDVLRSNGALVDARVYSGSGAIGLSSSASPVSGVGDRGFSP
jgi:hypothetical protein